MSSLSTNTLQAFVDHALLHVGPGGDQTLLQFIDIMYCGLVDMVLHQPSYLSVHWIQVWEFGDQSF